MVTGTEILSEDKKLNVSITRPDVALVYRYLRDHGDAPARHIAEACFPLTFGSLDPLYRRLFKKSMAKTLLSIEWLRGQGVDIVLKPVPGSLSEFSLTDRDVV